MMLRRLPKPSVIAHRGASAYAPENTLAAFELAVEQSADAIELDAKLSSDEQVMVIHDQTVDRTTPHSGRVRDYSAALLNAMDADTHFDAAYSGETIPTLAQVFERVGQRIFINVELTNYASPGDALPKRVAEVVRRYQMQSRVLFSSFNPLALLRIGRCLPECPRGLLCESGKRGRLARGRFGRLLHYDTLNPELNDVTTKLVQGVHRRGKKLLVYTVNQEEDMRRMFDLGVDGIFTDDPLLAQKVRREMH
jgi:glycerophosphoryl diester phosphodiesterase